MRKLICTLLSLALFMTSIMPLHAFATDNSSAQIIIDAGHGGIDGGAVGFSGNAEKEINLEIALKLRDVMYFLGYDVITVRETDTSIEDSGTTTIRQIKASDLRNRLKLTVDNPNAVYISIHQNKFSDSSQDGMCFYYSPNNNESKAIADIMHSNLLLTLQPDNRRSVKAAQSNLYILYNSQVPTVLVECGFISNPEEEELLMSDNYQKQISLLLSMSILQSR